MFGWKKNIEQSTYEPLASLWSDPQMEKPEPVLCDCCKKRTGKYSVNGDWLNVEDGSGVWVAGYAGVEGQSKDRVIMAIQSQYGQKFYAPSGLTPDEALEIAKRLTEAAAVGRAGEVAE